MPTDAVTGATSYTGRFIAAQLAERGRDVINLTRRPSTGLAGASVTRTIPFPPDGVDGRDALAHSLQDVDTLYNTHWIRFERGERTYRWATSTIETLLTAARRAGVRRVVHISVVHASHDAPTAYFRAKAEAEDAVASLAESHAIVRPTVTFGPGDILVNNLAWTLRHLPVFGIPGDGRYPIQPVHVADIARIAVEAGEATADLVVDAAGPETFEFHDFVETVRRAVGSRAIVVHLPVPIALTGAGLIGLVVRDAVLRRDEVTELKARLMISDEAPLGTISFRGWVSEHAGELGRHWSSELDRHYRSSR